MADRVVVFFDYQNVHGWARRMFKPIGCHPALGHVDPLRTAQHLVQRRKFGGVLEQVRVYRGRPNPERQPGATRANDRQTEAWESSPLVKVVRRNLQYPRDYPTSRASEKGIDVAIAVDMIRMSMAKELDVAILFSSDKDLLPAMETIRDLSLSHLEVATWSGANRLRFDGTQAPWAHIINEQQFKTLEDETDYSAR